MDRCAVFIDAGYLFAEGGKLCTGTRSRSNLLLDGAGFVEMLSRQASGHCGVSMLRTYWYDGAKDGVATAQQQVIAALADVKLRLGRLNGQMQQKGVDALIYRDLMTLARERAISDAYLLSGDEDLREGVRAAQDMGVRVGLFGIRPSGQDFNQSRELVREADTVTILEREDLAPFLSTRKMPVTAGPVQDDPFQIVGGAARAFAEAWGLRAQLGEAIALNAGKPVIPKTLDLDLLLSVEEVLGTSLHGNEALRRHARRVFWESVAAPSTDGQDAGSFLSKSTERRKRVPR